MRPPAAAPVADAQGEGDTSVDKADNRQWATGHKLSFLESRIEDWKEACLLEEVSDFYDNITVKWIAMWGWHLPAETDAPPAVAEPSAAELEAVFVATEQTSEEAERRRIFFWDARGVST